MYIQDVDVPARAGRGAHPARDRQPGEGDVRGAAARRDVAHRDGEGQGHRRHAGAARGVGQVGIQIKTNEAAGPRGARRGAKRPTCELTGQAEATKTAGDRSRRGQGHRGARPRPGRPASRRRRRRSARPRPRWSRSRTRWPTATSPWCPRCSSPAGGGGSFDGLAATLMRYLGTGSSNGKRAPAARPAPARWQPAARDVATGDEPRRRRAHRRRGSRARRGGEPARRHRRGRRHAVT